MEVVLAAAEQEVSFRIIVQSPKSKAKSPKLKVYSQKLKAYEKLSELSGCFVCSAVDQLLSSLKYKVKSPKLKVWSQ